MFIRIVLIVMISVLSGMASLADPLPTSVCTRTQQVVEVLENTLGRGCWRIRAEHLEQLTELDLGAFQFKKPITGFQAHDFHGLKNLETLILTGNKVSTLPEGLFQDQANLRQVWLADMGLMDIPETLFSTTPALQSVSLANNQLVSIPAKLLQPAASLHSVFLQGNQMTTVIAEIFYSAQIVYLKDNPIPQATREMVEKIYGERFDFATGP